MKQSILLFIFLLILTSFLTYYKVLDFAFTGDMFLFFAEYGKASLGKMLTSPLFPSYFPKLYYRPVMYLSHHSTFKLFGLDPFGYHFIILIMHALNSILLFVFCLLLTKKEYVSLLAGLLFIIHPINIYVIQNAGFLSTTLGFTFFILSLITFVLFDKTMKLRFLVFSIIFSIISLGIHEIFMVIPVIFLLYVIFLSKHGLKRRLVYFFPFLVILPLYMLLRFQILGQFGATREASNWQHNMFYITSEFFTWLIYPVNFLNINLRELSLVFFKSNYWIPLIFVFGLSSLYTARKLKFFSKKIYIFLLIGLLVFLLGFNFGKTLRIRHLYTPLMFFSTLFSISFFHIIERIKVKPSYILILSVYLILLLTFVRFSFIFNNDTATKADKINWLVLNTFSSMDVEPNSTIYVKNLPLAVTDSKTSLEFMLQTSGSDKAFFDLTSENVDVETVSYMTFTDSVGNVTSEIEKLEEGYIVTFYEQGS